MERWTWERYCRIQKDIVAKIDKSVERWTWERYCRTQKDIAAKIDKSVERWTWERYCRTQKDIVAKIDKSVERWTWERYCRTQNDLVVKLAKYWALTDYLNNRLEDPRERLLLHYVMSHRLWKTPLPNREAFEAFSQKVEAYHAEQAPKDPSGGYNNHGVTRYFDFRDFEEIDLPIQTWTFTSTAKLVWANQYNHPQVHIEKGDYVLDCGAEFGDTSLWFSYLTGEKGQVACFEFLPAFVERIHNNLNLNPELSDRITVNPYALWDRSGERLDFMEAGGITRVNGQPSQSENAAETITIDDWVERNEVGKLDFIKMDIEGAEVKALTGAKKTLQRFRPKLAICLYHNDSDFVNIPALIDSYQLGYRFYFSNIDALDSTNALLTVLAYTIQIYFDFSGYCDMAIGIGRMMNLKLPMNFDSPYKSLTITEFWERWHMTLTRFFTRYIYIPLGGNRRG